MSYLAIFKRIIPFLLTFGAGLFIASFFVTIALPNFNGFRRNRAAKYECNQLRQENQELRRENSRVRQENEQLRQSSQDLDVNNLRFVVPEIDVDAPPPPPPVKRPHHGDR